MAGDLDVLCAQKTSENWTGDLFLISTFAGILEDVMLSVCIIALVSLKVFKVTVYRSRLYVRLYECLEIPVSVKCFTRTCYFSLPTPWLKMSHFHNMDFFMFLEVHIMLMKFTYNVTFFCTIYTKCQV